VELLPRPMTASSVECTIELQDESGAMVRMHVKGARMADLASFASAWWSTRA
jgi:hypothetical protein